jgi:rod shape determining protein RodA
MLDTPNTTVTRARTTHELHVGAMLRRLDWLLIAGIAGLVIYGLKAVADITANAVPGDPRYYLVRQELYAGFGLIVFVVAAALNPDLYRRYWRILYALALAGLVLVPLIGVAKRHARRWLDIGSFQLQPSEFGKILLVLALAGFLADRRRTLHEARTIAGVLVLFAIPTALVFFQPDLGTALVYAATTSAILLVAGTRWSHLAVLTAIATTVSALVLWVLPALGVNVLATYQKDRLTGFIHPSSDPQGATYNVSQSKIALGAGGLHGRGKASATQSNLGFLPEPNTDFIFPAIGEQQGFIGCVALLGLYLLVVWRGMRALVNAGDGYSAVLVGGIVFGLVFQVFINAGMTMGIAPVTGIPLPLVSVGGSSMIANLAALGVLVGIQMRADRSSGRLM